MNDQPKHDEAAANPSHGDQPAGGQPKSDRPKSDRPASDRDEAPPGTPGSGENIDPKTGERFTEGIGGA